MILFFSFLTSNCVYDYVIVSPYFIPFIVTFFQSIYFINSHNANNANVAVAVPSSGVEKALEVVDTNATTDTRTTDIKIDHDVPSWSVAEYKTLYADTFDGRRLGAMFSDGANSFIFNRRDVCRNTNIGAWNLRTGDRCFCGDGAPAHKGMLLVLTDLSFAIQQRLVISVVYYSLCGMSMFLPSIVVLIFSGSRIQWMGYIL